MAIIAQYRPVISIGGNMRGKYTNGLCITILTISAFAVMIAALATGLRISMADTLDVAGMKNETAFKTIHMFNLGSTADENELIAILNQFNDHLVKLGHPESQYKLWKLSENEKGERTYLWESDWINKKVYDQIHENNDYKNLVKKFFMKFAVMLGDHKYYKYSEIPLMTSDSL